MHPNAWKRIGRTGGSGQFVSGGELFSYAVDRRSVDIEHRREPRNQRSWFALSVCGYAHSSPLSANAELDRNLTRAWSGLLLVLAAVAVAIAYYGARRREADRTIHG